MVYLDINLCIYKNVNKSLSNINLTSGFKIFNNSWIISNNKSRNK